MKCVNLAAASLVAFVVAAAAGAAASGTFRGTVAYDASSGPAPWIEARDPATGKTRRLTSPVASRGGYSPFDELEWSPDGRRLAFARAQGSRHNIYVVDRASAELVSLTASMSSQYANIAWSPDGTMLAFSRYKGAESGVCVAGADGSNLRCVHPLSALITISAPPAYPEARYEVDDIAWQPDGETLLYVVNDTGAAHGGSRVASHFSTGRQSSPWRFLGQRRSDCSQEKAGSMKRSGRRAAAPIGYTHYTHGGWPYGTLAVMAASGQGKRAIVREVWGLATLRGRPTAGR